MTVQWLTFTKTAFMYTTAAAHNHADSDVPTAYKRY